MQPIIHTAAVVFFSRRGEILTVRKRGTNRFMLVGGKPEAGEGPRQAALREIREEIGLREVTLDFLGMWQAPAANEAGFAVHGTVFTARAPLAATPLAAAEIAEVAWLQPDAPLPQNLAPLLQRRILPALSAGGRWPARGVDAFRTWQGGNYRHVEVSASQLSDDELRAAIPTSRGEGELFVVSHERAVVAAVEAQANGHLQVYRP